MDSNDMEYLIHHLFLPPKLPQEDDCDVDKQIFLLSHVVESAAEFVQIVEEHSTETSIVQRWKILHSMLSSMQETRYRGNISLEKLQIAVENMKPDDILSLHITKQNAGVILRKTEQEIFLEYFQASPPAAKVTGHTGKLIIQFPSRPRLSFPDNPGAVKALCAYLAEMDITEMEDAIPETRKAGSNQKEYRDVADIRYISELLGGIARTSTTLTSDVESVAETTQYVTKRINDHVLWKDAPLPWRRDPQWLIIRVALQTSLAEWDICQEYGYKVFVTYILARALRKACDANVEHDLLYSMNAKIAARLLKLQHLPQGGFPGGTALQFIANQSHSCSVILHRHWGKVRSLETENLLDLTPPPRDDIRRSEGFSLHSSRAYLSTVYNRSSALQLECDIFSPQEFRKSLLKCELRKCGCSPPDDIPTGLVGVDLWRAIIDVERWIVDDVSIWLSNTTTSNAVVTLQKLITRLDSIASSLDNPESFSRVFLIILELWVSLDKTAVKAIPMMKKYSPEISVGSLAPLILPKMSQMSRLHEVEKYLLQRRGKAIYGGISLFKMVEDPKCFASQYFLKNNEMKELCHKIILTATESRNKKLRECEALNDEYYRLKQRSESLSHEYQYWKDRWDISRSCHSIQCQKCYIEKQAEGLRIGIFEWPLPEDDILSRIVVFELRLPESFGIWRDVTYFLARSYSYDSKTTSSPPEVILKNYDGLHEYFEPMSTGVSQQVSIASTAKSFLRSHYSSIKIPCNTTDTVKHHPLRYQLYNASSSQWMTSALPAIALRKRCTPALQHGPYEQLSWAISATDHTPNMVIAWQSRCPTALSYHEWDAFGHLRAGNRLQWRNMMLEVFRGNLTLRDPAVYLLFRQAAWQVERGSDAIHRESHLDLADESFGNEMLQVLGSRFESICMNWQESWTVATLSLLACRLFSLCESSAVQANVLQFLESLRERLSKWMEQVLDLLKNADLKADTASIKDLRDRVIQIAATCRSTYMIDLNTVSSIFQHSRSLSIFVRSAIILQNHLPANLCSLSPPLRYLVERDISHSIELFQAVINTIGTHDGLDDAIKELWEGFTRDPNVPWEPIGDGWIICQTSAPRDIDQIRYVYLNLFDGNFLVDGKAVGNLPKDILRHPLFRTLFPTQSTMNIVPSTMKGTAYQKSHNVSKRFEVHFYLAGVDLIIRVRDIEHQSTLEFVPTYKLRGDIPNALVSGTVHLFNESTQSLEFYPGPSGWNPTALPIWSMHFTGDPGGNNLSFPKLVRSTSDNVGSMVLSPRCALLERIHGILQCLVASVTDLLVLWKPASSSPGSSFYPDGILAISLPDYKLNFSIDRSGNIVCKELPGFSISKVQSIGTLFGLRSKLVLESKDTNSFKKVIIPDGDIKISGRQIDSHPDVKIIPAESNGSYIRIFLYDVDDILGRLVGDGTLTSWFLLAYLHIITSSYFTDPLTQRTGVQEGLSMLSSSNSFAFMELTDEAMKFLSLILNITPIREYYPQHLTVMETVKWHPVLSPLSQSEMYVPLVQAIISHGRSQSLFKAEDKSTPTIKYGGKKNLRERAEIRNSRLISMEFHVPERIQDVPFIPSRCVLGSGDDGSVKKEYDVAKTAMLAGLWTSHSHPENQCNLWEQFRSWGSFSTPAVDSNRSLYSVRTWLFLDPAQTWFSLFLICLNASQGRDTYGLMFALAIVSYRNHMDIWLVHALMTVATRRSLRSRFRQAAALLPLEETFNLEPGASLTAVEIRRIAERYATPFESSPEAGLSRRSGESPEEALERRINTYKTSLDYQCSSLAKSIFTHWPCSGDNLPDTHNPSTLIDMHRFMKEIKGLFSTRFLNYRLFGHTTQLQSVLDEARKTLLDPLPPLSACPLPPEIRVPNPSYTSITLEDFLSGARLAPTGRSSTLAAIRDLVSRFHDTHPGGFHSRYATDMSRSVDALEMRPSPRLGGYNDIRNALSPQSIPETAVFEAGLWPSLSPVSLLRYLSFDKRREMAPEWKQALVNYAKSLVTTQRERRLAQLQRPGSETELMKEVSNSGGEGWDALTYPDWLLIQIESNLLIRPVQASIAKEMMSPTGGENTVMQLNMGEGKSSVIVPIISAALANGKQLVRVVVLKPLCSQMFRLLKQRLCGLANRRLFYLPFNRNIQLDANKLRKISDLFKTCAKSGGILLCQPEHILSFKLMGTHMLCNDGDSEQTRLLIEAQAWLDQTSRDILDESDEILNVRYQLIYTLGTPRPMQGQPSRWQVSQEVFSLLTVKLRSMVTSTPEWLELQDIGPHCFPRTRIHAPECGRVLLEDLAKQIVFEEKMSLMPFRSYTPEIRKLAHQFITDVSIAQSDSDILKKYCGEFFERLLLLRGLIAHGIILLCLKEKRWRVDYGLDPTRSMLAVPYRAKDSPAPRAEFGHPEVIIVLTCLCYYYSGLSNTQLDTTFSHLLNSDSADVRYQDWIKGSLADLPRSVHSLSGLNLEDSTQKLAVFGVLKYNKSVIDFYLSERVFPMEAKEFPFKLTTNAWDLAQKKEKVITGFSGTNDHSYLLPLSIHQLNSEEQSHTNAEVIEHLLRAENQTVVNIGSNVTALDLLQRVVEQIGHATVLLDVGAQVLELQNKEVAKEWLKRDTSPTIEAAIYCDPQNDEFNLLTRDDQVEPLVSSLYRSQLDKTLVYLDEARTRGTDFKFPSGTRAVVTLGPKLGKDKLVQGCMRLRKLGNGHSVSFFATNEICEKIKSCNRSMKDHPYSRHVLAWAMTETCVQIEDNGALWANQGFNFDSREQAWEQYNKSKIVSELAHVLRETESRTLEELYGVDDNKHLPPVGTTNQRLISIYRKCDEYGITAYRNATLSEEQERELAHEKEDEREVERIFGAQYLDHIIDPALPDFISTGTTAATFLSLSDCLVETSYIPMLRQITNVFFQSTSLRATVDFSKTIKVSSTTPGSMNDFLRPVQWILRSINSQKIVLISPFEANALLPQIRESNNVRLHVYSPRVSRRTPSLDHLSFFTVPKGGMFGSPKKKDLQQLNLFAGQLFFNDQEAFRVIREMLGLHLGAIPDHLKGKVDMGGFVVDKDARRSLGIRECAFDASPVAFMRELTGWRRKGEGFTLTHLGRILHGRNLDDSEFDD